MYENLQIFTVRKGDDTNAETQYVQDNNNQLLLHTYTCTCVCMWMSK